MPGAEPNYQDDAGPGPRAGQQTAIACSDLTSSLTTPSPFNLYVGAERGWNRVVLSMFSNSSQLTLAFQRG